MKLSKQWKENLDKFVLEKSINWDLAIVKNVSDTKIEIETKDNYKGLISQKDITWIKKSNNYLKPGDIIYVKKNKNNYFDVKQIPTVNVSI